MPGTRSQRTTSSFSLDVGYIYYPGSVEVTVYNKAGTALGNVVTEDIGINHLVAEFNGAASFVVHAVGDGTVGFAIDNVDPWSHSSGYIAMGDSYSSGEGNPPFYPGPGKCDVSPAAWPSLMVTLHPILTELANFACSGASPADVMKDQLPALRALQDSSSRLQSSLS